MTGDYHILAPIYNQIGMGNFAREITPALIEFAQQNDWLGRHILDLGCGTGDALIWLAKHNYRVTALDNSQAMLNEAKTGLTTQGLDTRLIEMDIREIDREQIGSGDLVLALDVINEMRSVREIEAVLENIHQMLEPGKWCIFDMHTLEGLSRRGGNPASIIYDDPEQLTVLQSNHNNYEHHEYTAEYLIFRREDGHWRRYLARRVLRTIPVQAMQKLLQRKGFALKFMLNTNLQPIDTVSVGTERIILIATKS
ncbi:MAG: class I SAM-dependent methyltransferase [Chloroflexi bacterium]|nr:MAG: hypothetical protein CUN54_06090 [Phototrophicales bacterium]RMF77468.1 MAG: class I SAM-dependent methyltransferase [Chloroflexota bacterium]